MLENFLLETLLSNNVYLGYTQLYADTKMSYHLIGQRKNIDLHHLSQTISLLKKVLALHSNIWKNFGVLWLILSGFKTELLKNSNLIEKLIFIWTKKWVPGLLSNRTAFVSASTTRLPYPQALFHCSYTLAKARFSEAKINKTRLLQAGLADTNSARAGYDYLINANEKSRTSYSYFIRLLLVQAEQQLACIKGNFIFE